MLMRFCSGVRQSYQLSSLRRFSEFKGVLLPDDGPIISRKTSETIPFGDSLPFGNSIKKLAKEKRIYVDKTDILYKLMTEFQECIFTRPRRFGKSLLISTLEAIFMKEPILKQLKISKHYEDLTEYPVINFDFSQNEALVQKHIKNVLNSHCALLGIDSSKEEDLRQLVVIVIEEYHRKGQEPCLLIDEYDSPLWVSDSAQGMANQILINDFFKTLKSLQSFAALHLLQEL